MLYKHYFPIVFVAFSILIPSLIDLIFIHPAIKHLLSTCCVSGSGDASW